MTNGTLRKLALWSTLLTFVGVFSIGHIGCVPAETNQEPADEKPDNAGEPESGQPQPPAPPDDGGAEEPLPDVPTVQLTVEVEGQGSVDILDASFDVGSEITLTATATDGWRFDRWTGDIDDTPTH